jgi:hypothetical protein
MLHSSIIFTKENTGYLPRRHRGHGELAAMNRRTRQLTSFRKTFMLSVSFVSPW